MIIRPDNEILLALPFYKNKIIITDKQAEKAMFKSTKFCSYKFIPPALKHRILIFKQWTNID